MTDMPKVVTHDDILAIERTPLSARWRPTSTFEAIAATAERMPEAPALTFLMEGRVGERGQTWSYAAFTAEIARSANLFRRLGATVEAPVALLLPNLPESHFALWGAETAAAAAPINPLLEPAQIAALLRATGARVVVTVAPLPGVDLHEKAIAAVDAAPEATHVLTVDALGRLPALKRTAARLLAKRPRTPRRAVLMDFAAARAGERAALDMPPPAPDAVCSYFHTGGTTGHPKVARHTHANETFDGWAAFQLTRLEPGSVALCGLPLFHVNAAIITGLGVFMGGGHVLLATPQGYRNQTFLKNFWAILEGRRVAFFSGVPTLYARLLAEPVGDRDLSALRFAVCGAAPMPVDLVETFERASGVRIIEGYGLTEGACASTLNPLFGERRVGSIGFRLPYQEMKAVILDAEGAPLRDAEIDEVGAIAIRGPNVFPGYLDPADDAKIWLGDGWLNTGDLGRRDAEGYFWLTGRAKDVIIRGGHNIDPSVIEEALARHPAVALPAAVGQLDAYAGELPVAYVGLRAGADATAAELLAFAREAIPERAAIPVRVEIDGALPTTAIGKVFKPELRRRAAEHALIAALEEAGLDPVGASVVLDPIVGMKARVATAEMAEIAGRLAIEVETDADADADAAKATGA